MEPAVRVLGTKVRPAADVAAFLEVAADSSVIEMRRVFWADGSAISYDCAYFPLPDFAWLLNESPSELWYELLRARRGISILYARTVVGATLADKEVAAHLDIMPGTALLHLRRQTYAQGDHPVAYTSALYRSDRYQFSVTLSRRPTAASVSDFEL